MSEEMDSIVIENIITAFQGYALSDIRFNKDRPISAAILIACLLDQMSCFFYEGGKARDRALKFVEKYLPQYKAVGIYDILRNPMVHNYSIRENYSVSSDPVFAGAGMSIMPEGIIYIPVLIDDVQRAIEAAVADLRTNPETRTYALKWHTDHKVLAMVQMSAYSGEQIQKLWAYYEPKIRAHQTFMHGHFEILLMTTGVGGDVSLANVLVKELDGNKTETFLSLKNFAHVLGLMPPDEYLASIEG